MNYACLILLAVTTATAAATKSLTLSELQIDGKVYRNLECSADSSGRIRAICDVGIFYVSPLLLPDAALVQFGISREAVALQHWDAIAKKKKAALPPVKFSVRDLPNMPGKFASRDFVMWGSIEPSTDFSAGYAGLEKIVSAFELKDATGSLLVYIRKPLGDELIRQLQLHDGQKLNGVFTIRFNRDFPPADDKLRFDLVSAVPPKASEIFDTRLRSIGDE